MGEVIGGDRIEGTSGADGRNVITGKDNSQVVNEVTNNYSDDLLSDIRTRLFFIEHDLIDIKERLTSRPTWFQVFTIVVTMMIVVLLFVFVTRISSLEKQRQIVTPPPNTVLQQRK